MTQGSAKRKASAINLPQQKGNALKKQNVQQPSKVQSSAKVATKSSVPTSTSTNTPKLVNKPATTTPNASFLPHTLPLSVPIGDPEWPSQSGLKIALEDGNGDIREIASEFLQWMIAPLSLADFFQYFYEKRPFAILRGGSSKMDSCQIVTTCQDLEMYLPSTSDEDDDDKPATNKPKSNKQTDSSKGTSTSTKASVQQESKTISNSTYKIEGAHYFEGWFSKDSMRDALNNSKQPMHYGKDLDIAVYKDGTRQTLNPPGEPVAVSSQVWSHYTNGCSIRFLCPHARNERVWRAVNLLDDAFGMMAGANSYLTPANSQGFAPHFDDVDVLVMQCEGSKRWRLYAPRDQSEILPRQSSPNFTQENLAECILDVWLQQGDFLYAPRGVTHQCVSSRKEHSLHVTFSTAQSSSWADYFATLLPMAINTVARDDVEFRRTLPLHYENYMGVMNSSDPNKMDPKEYFMDKTFALLERLVTREDGLPADEAADFMALESMRSRVRPWLHPIQKQRMIHGALPKDSKKKKDKYHRHNAGDSENSADKNRSGLIRPTTYIRLAQGSIARLTAPSEETNSEDTIIQLHHIADNTIECRGAPMQRLDIDIALAGAVETLISSYPEWTRVSELPLPEVEDDLDLGEDDLMAENIHLLSELFDSGLIEMTNNESVATAVQKSENPYKFPYYLPSTNEDEDDDDNIIDDEDMNAADNSELDGNDDDE